MEKNKPDSINVWGREPWELRETKAGPVKHLQIFDADNHHVLTIVTVSAGAQIDNREKTIGERIVACVNWCKQ